MQNGLAVARLNICDIVAICTTVLLLLSVSIRRKARSGIFAFVYCLLLPYRNNEVITKDDGRATGVTWLTDAAAVSQWRERLPVPSNSLSPCLGGGKQRQHRAFICQSYIPTKERLRSQIVLNAEEHEEGTYNESEAEVAVDVDTKSPKDALEDGNKKPVRRRSGAKRIRPDTFPGPLTVADVIKHRIIAQPPSLEYTRRVLARKPWKRMNIPALIKQEKQKIEETDQFLDRYFYQYLNSRGTASGLSSGVKDIDVSLFKSKDVTTEKAEDESGLSNVHHYTVEELIQIWNTKGGYFYTNIPKTVAMLQIVRRIAKESSANQEVRKIIREHTCFKRIVGSVVRHMKYVTRIELPSHLKNYQKLINMVPMFNEQQMTTIFSVLAYFGFRNEKVIEAMLNHAKPYKRFKPEDMRSVIMACLSMNFDPSPIVEEYIEKLKGVFKNGSESITAAGGEMDYYLDVLHICSKSDHMNNWIFSHIADFIKKSENMTIDEAANAVCLFTDLQHLDEALYKHLYDVLTKNIGSIKGKTMVKKLITSLAMSHFKPPKQLVDHLANTLLKDINAYSLVEITAALRSLSLMDCYNEELCRKVFNLGIFVNPPSVKVLQQINLQMNQKKAVYAAYLHPAASSSLNIVFGNLYQAYLGYRLLGKSQNKFKLHKDAEGRLKEIYTAGVKNWTFSSSSFHLQVRDLLKEAFGIDCAIEHVTNEGLVVDIAILPSSLAKYTEHIGAKDFLKDKKCAIEVHGPFHYLQKSTERFPPPLDNTTLFKERILRETGWDVSHLHYWSFVPWMKREHKIRVLARLMPKWVKNLCKGVAD